MIGHTLRIIAVFFVLVGGLNWGLTAGDYNLVEKINRMLSERFRTRLRLDKFIYIVVGLCALGLFFDRTMWLPFLGESVLPGTLVPLKAHSGNTQVKVQVSPGAKVAYWSAMPGDDAEIDVRYAYAKFGNSGVVMADALMPMAMADGRWRSDARWLRWSSLERFKMAQEASKQVHTK